jgi:glyoxylase-like metal-dependent hydrolase (beta-lactamase superfamily II)
MHLRVSTVVLLFVAGSLVATLAGAQQGNVPDPLIAENATIQVGDHTWVIPDGNVSLVPNVGIVVGSRATLVIDPGLGRRNGETVLREARRLSPDNELYVASTHYHTEHTTGYLAFPASARYISSTVQAEEFEQGGQQQIRSFSGRSALTAELLSDATVFPPDITFDREHVLDLGGVAVRFLVVGPTHTRGDTGFLVVQDAVLFSGDVVMNESFLAARQESSMRAWLAAFDAFEAMRPRVVVPAHGAVGEGSIIATNRAVMETIQTRARELKAQGRSADEVAQTVQAELQARYPDWPRANGIPAAARAAYAEAP